MNDISKTNIKRGLGALIGIGIVGLIVALYIFNNPSYPSFSYDTSSINGWYANQNGNQQKLARSLGSRYQGQESIDNLPVADLTIHHGEKDSETTPDDNCFVGFSYYDYPLGGLDAAYVEYEDRKKAQGELEELESIKQTIKTFEGDETYELRQYDYVIEGEDVLSGYQVGFVEMKSGHIRVEGVCKTADDLALTQPILEAVTLNEY